MATKNVSCAAPRTPMRRGELVKMVATRVVRPTAIATRHPNQLAANE